MPRRQVGRAAARDRVVRETETPETNAFTLTIPTYQQCYDRLRDYERSRDALLSRLAEAERERDELQVAASLSTEYRHKYHEALRERDSEHAARVAAEKDAGRYRQIRLKAWLDSCVDDLVVNTPQAKESEFNNGYDAMIDAEYPENRR